MQSTLVKVVQSPICVSSVNVDTIKIEGRDCCEIELLSTHATSCLLKLSRRLIGCTYLEKCCCNRW